MSNTVWQLRGSMDKVLECCVDRTASRSLTVTVVFGNETFLSETYPDETSALVRATQVRDGLLTSGGWTIVSQPVIVSPCEETRASASD
jgi:hypothetical protein